MKLTDIIEELLDLAQRTCWPDGSSGLDVTRQTSASTDAATEAPSQQDATELQNCAVSVLQLQHAAGNAVLWCLAAATTSTSFSDGTSVVPQLLELLPVFSKLYAVEDLDMVDSVIASWELVASILAGAAELSPGAADQLQASCSSHECLLAGPDVTTTSSSSSSTLEASSNSSCSTPGTHEEGLRQLQRLLQWDPALVQAVVALLHHYTASTGLQTLQQHASSKGLKALLLLLCCHAQATQDTSVASSQLLALACGRTLPATPAVTAGQGVGQQPLLDTMSGLAAALPLSEAFDITAQLVQLASTSIRLHPAWCDLPSTSPPSSSSSGVGSSAPQQLLGQQEQASALSAAAGQCLVAAFSPAPGNSGQDCPLSAAMVMLLHRLYQGDHTSGTAAAAAAAGSVAAGGTSRSTGPQPVAEQPHVAITKAQQAAHSEWLGTAPVAALAPLAAAYPHPQLLMRSLLALALPAAAATMPAGAPQAAAGAPAPAPGGTGGSGAAEDAGPPAATAPAAGGARRASEAAKELAAFAQVCRVLQAVYAPRGALQQQAALLHQLLVALADPLGPAANCSVAVRCSALQRMAAAVDGFMEDCAGLEPDASLQLQQQLWDELSLGAPLFALRWDGAARVRRAAAQLLQRVALPLQGEAVGQLAVLLADKCGDKDAQVRVAALELLVQLPLPVLLGHLQEAHWWRLLQAGVALAAPTEQPAGQEGHPTSSEECGVALLRLMQQVLHMSPSPAGPAVRTPIWRVQQLTRLMLTEPLVSEQVARLMSHWHAVVV